MGNPPPAPQKQNDWVLQRGTPKKTGLRIQKKETNRFFTRDPCLSMHRARWRFSELPGAPGRNVGSVRGGAKLLQLGLALSHPFLWLGGFPNLK